MKLFIYLGHPAHYHTVAPLLPEWKEAGHEPVLLVRDKDVLLELLQGTPYRTIPFPSRKSNSWFNIFWSTLRREWKMFRLTVQERPAALIGTDITIAHAGYWTGVPSILINEDDSEVVPKLAHLGFRYARKVFAPQSCDISPYEKKKVSYRGVHEIAYLHPDRFTPDRELLEGELPAEGVPYVLLRSSALNAHHDKGIGGISTPVLRELLEHTRPFAKVLISAEGELPEDLEPYRSKFHPSLMHHALAFAQLLVSDSQTMTAEAAVLGIPSVRFSDLTGRLGYLDSLEKEHGLTFGYRTDEKGSMLRKVEELLQNKELTKEWTLKRDRFLGSSDDPLEILREEVGKLLQKGEEKKGRSL